MRKKLYLFIPSAIFLAASGGLLAFHGPIFSRFFAWSLERAALDQNAARISSCQDHLAGLGEEAITAVLPLLSHGDPAVRRSCYPVIQRIGESAETRIAASTHLLDHARYRAWEFDRIVSEPIPDGSSQWERERAAEEKLLCLGETAVLALVELLEEGRAPATIVNEIDLLTRFGPQARRAVPALTRILQGADPPGKGMPEGFHVAQFRAATAIAAIGPEAGEALPALVSALQSENPDFLGDLAKAFKAIGPVSAVPLAIALKNNKDARIRAHAARFLGDLTVEDVVRIPLLTEALADPDLSVRREAALALVGTRADPAPTIPVLLESLRNGKDGWEACIDIRALRRIGSRKDEVVEVLADVMETGPTPGSFEAAFVLQEWGMEPSRVLPHLRRAVEDGREDIRIEAFRSLCEIGLPAKEAVPEIIEALPRCRDRLLGVGIYALDRVDPDFRFRMKTWLAGKDEKYRRIALVAFSKVSTLRPLAREKVDDLVVLLKSPDAEFRKLVVDAWMQARPDVERTVPALCNLLDEPDPALRHDAAWALGLAGPAAADAVPALLKRLADPASEVRSTAIFALERIGPITPEVLPALVRATKDEDWVVRSRALDGLRGFGPLAEKAVADLAGRLDNPGPADDPWEIAVTLASIDPHHPHSIPILMKALKDGSESKGMLAAKFLGRHGPLAKEAVPVLRKALESPFQSIRREAAFALWAVSSDADRAIPILCETLRGRTEAEGEGDVDWFSLDYLREIGPAAAAALPAIERVSREGERSWSRLDAADAIWRISADRSKVVAILKNLTEKTNEDAILRLKAAVKAWEVGLGGNQALELILDELEKPDPYPTVFDAVRRLGPAAKPTVPKLLAWVETGNAPSDAVLALGSLGVEGRGTQTLLAGILSDSANEEDLRAAAAMALGRISPLEPDQSRTFKPFLQDSVPAVRYAVAVALAERGDEDATPVLAEAVRRGFESPLEETPTPGEALAGLGPSAREAVPVLTQALKYPDSRLRADAAWALWKITGKTEPAVASLVLVLRDPDAEMRARACRTLAQIKPSAPEVLADLHLALHDPSWDVRTAAREAVEKFAGGREGKKDR